MINGLMASAESGNVIITRDSGLRYLVYVLERLPNGTPVNTLYLKKGTLVRQKFIEGSNNIIPFMAINYGQSEDIYSDLVDALLKLGIKPKTEVMTKQEKSSIEKHLSDMWIIVSKKLGVEL
jgi:hypothetical protein